MRRDRSVPLWTTLYFGLARPKGSVSELEWQVFLRDEVTTRFPEGLTVWEANGQWRRPDGEIDHERSRVLLLVHPDTATARGAVQAVYLTVPSEIRTGISAVGVIARLHRLMIVGRQLSGSWMLQRWLSEDHGFDVTPAPHCGYSRSNAAVAMNRTTRPMIHRPSSHGVAGHESRQARSTEAVGRTPPPSPAGRTRAPA